MVAAGTGRHAALPGPVRTAWTDLLHLVLPTSCAGCRRPDKPLCADCLGRLPRGGWQVPGPPAPGAPPTWAGGDYAGVLQRVVLAFKDDGRHDLAGPLAGCLARSAHAALTALLGEMEDVLDGAASDPTDGAGPLLLVPAPSSRATVRRRGADLTAGLARGAAVRLRRRGWPVSALPALAQRRGVRDQAGLTAQERHHNLAGRLRVRRGSPVAGRAVLLVDDVVTTGSTLAAAAAVLTGHGAVVLGAATVAATPRLDHSEPRRPRRADGPDGGLSGTRGVD